MLFAIDSKTPKPKVMECLNEVFVHFFEKAVNGRKFECAFKGKVGIACLKNQITRGKFFDVWNDLKGKKSSERQAIFNLISNSQNIESFFNDTTLDLPDLYQFCSSVETFNLIKQLGAHLFSETSGLKPIIDHSKSSLIDHYNQYVAKNGFVCRACGTAALSQARVGILENKQWRSDYDHLLNQANYPIYSVHPSNFIPLCETCNRKAKGAKHLLLENDSRCLAFNPHKESAEDLIEVSQDETVGSLIVEIISQNNIQDCKSDTWERVFQVKSRVNAKIVDYLEFLINDTQSESLDDFSQQVYKRSKDNQKRKFNDEWWFWRMRLYQWIVTNKQEQKIWNMIEEKMKLANEGGALDEEFS